MQGGKFEHGFFSGFVSSLGGLYMQNSSMDDVTKIALSAVIGGTAEKLGGGKFANGAVTGAYVMMLNHLSHIWHPSRGAAASSAEANTEQTGNETSVLIFEDENGEQCYWECPQNGDSSPTSADWVAPSEEEIYGLKLVGEFHYSVGEIFFNGKMSPLKGSFEDWRNSHMLKINVTHISIGRGSWLFTPSLFFEQPKSIIFPNYRQWDIDNPIVAPNCYKKN